MYYQEDTIIYLNGEWVKAKDAKTDLFSQTLHYGYGVFEGLRSYATPEGPHIFKVARHFERLLKSSKKLRLKLPYTAQQLTGISYELLKKNNLTDAYIRPLVYGGQNMALHPSREVNFMMAAWKWDKYHTNHLLDVEISDYRRPNPLSCHIDAKLVGQYTSAILASSAARSKGFDEALLLDDRGFVAQGPGSNFFYEKDDVLYTPPEGSILPGITRAIIMQYAEELGHKVKEKLFKPDELKKADAAFFTGTATEVAGIRSIDGKRFKLEWEDSIGYSLLLIYRKHVMNKEIQNFTLV
jgi:branched-chain amino acid aminotransferase